MNGEAYSSPSHRPLRCLPCKAWLNGEPERWVKPMGAGKALWRRKLLSITSAAALAGSVLALSVGPAAAFAGDPQAGANGVAADTGHPQAEIDGVASAFGLTTDQARAQLAAQDAAHRVAAALPANSPSR